MFLSVLILWQMEWILNLLIWHILECFFYPVVQMLHLTNILCFSKSGLQYHIMDLPNHITTSTHHMINSLTSRKLLHFTVLLFLFFCLLLIKCCLLSFVLLGFYKPLHSNLTDGYGVFYKYVNLKVSMQQKSQIKEEKEDRTAKNVLAVCLLF